jgi:hypothetical protein
MLTRRKIALHDCAAQVPHCLSDDGDRLYTKFQQSLVQLSKGASRTRCGTAIAACQAE